ncbi:N-acetylmuramoyl-L-alanine amidase [Pediococcus claussenii]|uniref:N-acetylmuramoyl-L-alanine amidase family protein n=1 Tax=Pediococcus claussenii (strain ATCC BAA-344 / DSM 14800 / JCM 18046 / KCTC 3811 / LMG 21948 / P06) TaxID=701521 RepID=G8PD95_PEDCP|nr:N-acetylmuramoyl-L-alanine amidase [Pediococcus claussenii]AEV95230.1 N-acetylmuramoyl-L-alanine amidase family protein [Pediococcus claussenii ATCC BAA-344]ANZ70459.1 N-acetylmuramoyl-L-alanine amidase [Pediococcus claussenii]ANZ72274.1 N-acetylmuramoyl-L-alanine amidase [Pediococcus claussenii]KRN19587.1 hypothetical protein IV79_GL001304 [Pediococcus claussenii]
MDYKKILAYAQRNVLQILIGLVAVAFFIILIPSFFRASQVTVGLNDVIIRDSPSRKSAKIGTLKQGQRVSLVRKDDVTDWDKIRFSDTKTGWIPSWLTNTQFKKGQQAIPLSEATIVIDPGHGGTDSGALGINPKHEEKKYTLRTSKEIYKKLSATGARVVLTRTTDTFVSLAARPKLANKLDADAFISIHYDSSGDDNMGTGDTTYYYHQGPSVQLGKDINSELTTKIPLYNRGVRYANYQVLRDNKRPAILVEGGYINSRNDFKEISSSDYPSRVASAVTAGLAKFIK